jgi:hypothetical protein
MLFKLFYFLNFINKQVVHSFLLPAFYIFHQVMVILNYIKFIFFFININNVCLRVSGQNFSSNLP